MGCSEHVLPGFFKVTSQIMGVRKVGSASPRMLIFFWVFRGKIPVPDVAALCFCFFVQTMSFLSFPDSPFSTVVIAILSTCFLRRGLAITWWLISGNRKSFAIWCVCYVSIWALRVVWRQDNSGNLEHAVIWGCL